MLVLRGAIRAALGGQAAAAAEGAAGTFAGAPLAAGPPPAQAAPAVDRAGQEPVLDGLCLQALQRRAREPQSGEQRKGAGHEGGRGGGDREEVRQGRREATAEPEQHDEHAHPRSSHDSDVVVDVRVRPRRHHAVRECGCQAQDQHVQGSGEDDRRLIQRHGGPDAERGLQRDLAGPAPGPAVAPVKAGGKSAAGQGAGELAGVRLQDGATTELVDVLQHSSWHGAVQPRDARHARHELAGPDVEGRARGHAHGVRQADGAGPIRRPRLEGWPQRAAGQRTRARGAFRTTGRAGAHLLIL
mmetsp:Transcript_52777/g.171708  ORF Transcript_52777/g.171708 Transcript_52777/m.171708 type:complete len:300 (+) Transcript_52777:618-1517(+)